MAKKKGRSRKTQLLNQRQKVLEIRDLSVGFNTHLGKVQAVRHLNLSVHRGETVAIVGESGSGKSVTVKTIMGLLPQTSCIDSGEILYHVYGDDKSSTLEKTHQLIGMSKKDLRHHINGQQIAMIFQDPMTSLDPTMPIGKQIMEATLAHQKVSRQLAYERALHLIELVGIRNAMSCMHAYPHQLSGGMRQRIVIAIALASDPKLLICDEPTTALDVTIQARILELIAEVQKKTGISVIYITHDLGVVAKVADYVAVMYAGRIVEQGRSEEIFYDPRHPYTWGLLSAMPDLNTEADSLMPIPGNPPNMARHEKGDPFAVRNPFALRLDLEMEAPVFRITDSHQAATWLLDPRAPKVERPAVLERKIQRMKEEAIIHGYEF
ncbi:MAG: ABC transporter ATP-binding protein [Eubacteriales bacterium]|nr:ABC transporter ATP-binding protein [Eubacteriales bacterium]